MKIMMWMVVMVKVMIVILHESIIWVYNIILKHIISFHTSTQFNNTTIVTLFSPADYEGFTSHIRVVPSLTGSTREIRPTSGMPASERDARHDDIHGCQSLKWCVRVWTHPIGRWWWSCGLQILSESKYRLLYTVESIYNESWNNEKSVVTS